MFSRRSFGARFLSVLLASVLFFSLFAQPLQAQPILPQAGLTGEDAVAQSSLDDTQESEVLFLPERARLLQERVGYSDVDMRDFGDLSLVLHTLTMDPVGAFGFEGEYTLPGDPNQLVEIVVQFVTPPSVVLGMMSDAQHPYFTQNVARTLMPYEALALSAHNNFESQLAGVPVPLGTTSSPRIIDSHHVLFNGLLMEVPAGMVEIIASLPEVFVVTPNFSIYFDNDDNELGDTEDLLEFMNFLAEAQEAASNLTGAEPQNRMADPNDWEPGSNTWSRGFMQESIERFGMNHIWNELGITGGSNNDAPIRMIIADSGLDYNHPRYHVFHRDNQPLPASQSGPRVPGSGGPFVPTPQEAVWVSGWGDGQSHGTHVGGSAVGMAPGVVLYAYRAALNNPAPNRVIGADGHPVFNLAGTAFNPVAAWGVVVMFTEMWNDGHRNGVKYYTRNVMNNSWGGGSNPFGGSSYVANVVTLTGYYLIVGSAGNSGPGLNTVSSPGDASLLLTVGAGRYGGWVSPFVYRNVIVDGNAPINMDLHTWDWGWMPLDANGWREAYPQDMGDILESIFNRNVYPFEALEQEPIWRRNNGLERNSDGSFNWVWVGAIANTDGAREAAANELRYRGIDVSGKVVVQHRQAMGTPGQQNPRNFWAQQGAGALIIVDDRPAGTTFTYSGGAGPQELIQGSIPLMSVPRLDALRVFPYPAGIISNTTHTPGGIPIISHLATEDAPRPPAGQVVNTFGNTGTINFGALTDYSERDSEGIYLRNTLIAPNYLATFSSVGAQPLTYHILPDIVGPGTQIHSMVPARTTNRWERALRDENGDFILTPAGTPFMLAGTPQEDIEWTPDWSNAYALFMGTSMSGPTVAGIAALVWDAFPNATPQEVKARIMNTARTMGSTNRPDPYHVLQVGAGFVDPLRAITQQAFATVLVDMPWSFHPNFPGTPGQPGGPPIGGAPGGSSNVMMARMVQSSLSFGAVRGNESHPLTVTISNAGNTPWTYTVSFNTATAQDELPHLSFDQRVSLETISTDTSGSTQTFEFVMRFPDGVPYGRYNGNVVFTNGSESITMPFLGVPFADDDFSITQWSGLSNPIITGFVREYENQEDLRHVTEVFSTQGTGANQALVATPVEVGALTHSNRSTILLGINYPGTLNPGARFIDLYSRRVTETGTLGDTIYYIGSSSITPRIAGIAPESLNNGAFWRHGLTSRVVNPDNPGQFINLEEGVYELFVAISLSPPRLVDGQIEPPLENNFISLPISRFVVNNTSPTIELEYDMFEIAPDGSLTISGEVISPAHELALYHNMQTTRNENNAILTASTVPFTHAHAALVFEGIDELHRPNADGSFSFTLEAPEALSDILESNGDIAGLSITAIDGVWAEFVLAAAPAAQSGIIDNMMAGSLMSLPVTASYESEASQVLVTAVGASQAQGFYQVARGVDSQFSASLRDNFGNTILGTHSFNWIVTGAALSANITVNPSTGLVSVPTDTEVGTTFDVVAEITAGGYPLRGIARAVVVSERVIVTPLLATVPRGSSQQFNAVVEGYNVQQGVAWAVEGAASAGTSISGAGLLSVSSNETATTLTVRATSIHNTSLSGTATVNVVAPPPAPGPTPPGAGAAERGDTGLAQANQASTFSLAVSAANREISNIRDAVSNNSTAESILAALQASLPEGVTAQWSPNAPFVLVPATAYAYGSISGTIIVTSGTYTSAIVIDFQIPMLGALQAHQDEQRRILWGLDSFEIIDQASGTAIFTMDVQPIIQEGRTLIPVRFMAYALGASVGWNEDTNGVTLSIEGRSITFAIGEMAPGMDVPAQIINERTFVPLRFISEFFGAEVNWDEATRTIEIVH